MDWGLFAKDAGENKFLRAQIVYDRKVRSLILLFMNILEETYSAITLFVVKTYVVT